MRGRNVDGAEIGVVMDWGDIAELCGNESRALRAEGPELHTLFADPAAMARVAG